MDPMQLTNAECGQSNPLVQITSHLTQDHANQDRIGNTSTFQCPNMNSMPPQTFRMKDLIQEINEIESQEAVGYSPPSSITWATQYQNQLAHPGLHQEIICEQIPQPMYLPQSHGLEFHFTPQPEGITYKIQKEINESFLENTEVSAYNKAEFKVIQSIDELVDCLENNNSQEDVKETTLTQESKSEKKIDEKVEILDSETNRLEEDCKSEVLTLLQMGKKHLSDGERTDAILCFEMAINLDATCVEAWTLLGIVWSESVQENKAIYALSQGLKLEPRNLDILMTLALVYSARLTNNYYKYKSFLILICWLKHHPEYKDIIPENFKGKHVYDNLSISDNFPANIKEVQDMFIEAARRRPINPDYQVQSALGILFNLSGEFDKAIDCYHSALQVRPRDARLWNRLAVTVSKQKKHEENIDLLKRALDLDPGLTCSHYNIALTYMNTNAYREAAEHLLIALNLQARWHDGYFVADYTSEEIWSNLCECLFYLGRSDLKTAVLSKNLEILNKEFGIIKI